MEGRLGLGKVTTEIFERSVLPFIPMDKELELDGATIKLTQRTVVAHSPSIGVPLDALGFFAFHYAACNVACRFGLPTYMITGIYLPLNTKEEDLKIISKNLGDEAKKFKVKIVAGQTATYLGLEIPFVSTTCLGEQIKKTEKVLEDDLVFLIGEVGGEAVWLTELSHGSSNEHWRNFTALPIIIDLHQFDGVKLLHDVSEGGVKGALIEILKSHGLRLKFNLKNVVYAKDAKKLKQDLLRAPTYGTLIAIVDASSAEQIQRTCEIKGIPCSLIGSLKAGSGLYIDGEQITEQARMEIDEIYGTFRQLEE